MIGEDISKWKVHHSLKNKNILLNDSKGGAECDQLRKTGRPYQFPQRLPHVSPSCADPSSIPPQCLPEDRRTLYEVGNKSEYYVKF